jgi:hypothetical protein
VCLGEVQHARGTFFGVAELKISIRPTTELAS